MEGGAGAAVPPGPVPLRRNRDFVLYWGSQVVSTIGTRITLVAYPLLVLAVTGSPAQAGLVAFAQTVPFLVFFLPAGALVDRVDRKRVMLLSDAIRALAMATVAVALALDRLAIPLLAGVAFVEGTFFVLFELAEAAALPHLVPAEQLPTAIAQNQARQAGADIVGQPLGGLLFGLGRGLPFLVDAISYGVSFVAILFIRPAFQGARERSRTRIRADIAAGVLWLWRQEFLRTVVFLVAGWNFVGNALVLVIIVRASELGASAALIGAVLACFGAGAIVGSLLAPAIQRRVRGRMVIAGSMWVSAAVAFAMVPLRWPLSLGVAAGIGAVVGPVFNVVVGAYRYALVPDELQGRVVSAARVVAWGAVPLGSLASGLLIEAIGTTSTIAVLATFMATVAAAGTVLRSVRRVPELSSR